MKNEITTVDQLKAELKSELENRVKSVEAELKELQAGFSELKDSAQVSHDVLEDMIQRWNKYMKSLDEERQNKCE